MSSALGFYKLLNDAGEGCFAAAAYNFVMSEEDRKQSASLIALGWVSKFFSLIPFYSSGDVLEQMPHPISATSYPALMGIVTANIVALMGTTPRAKAVGKFGALIAGGVKEYLQANIAFQMPSTFWCASRVCIPSDLFEETLCKSVHVVEHWHNTSEGRKYINRTFEDCVQSHCMEDSELFNGYIQKEGLIPPFTVFSICCLYLSAYADLLKYQKNPLQLENNRSLCSRIQLAITNILLLAPFFIHFLLIRLNTFYRVSHLSHAQSLFLNMPYIVLMSAILATRRFSFDAVDTRTYCLSVFIALILSNVFISRSSCSMPPEGFKSPIRLKE